MTVAGRVAPAPADNAPVALVALVALVETAVARRVGSGPVDKDPVGRAVIAVVAQVARVRVLVARVRADSARREVGIIKPALLRAKAGRRVTAAMTAAMTARRVRRCSRASPSCVRRCFLSRQPQRASPSK